MASTSFYLNEFTGGNTRTQVTLTEVSGGVQATVEVLTDPVSGNIGDITGVFFHIKNESLLNTINVTGTDVNGVTKSLNNVDQAENNASISPQKFDVGVAIGETGMGGGDDIRTTTFIISSTSKTLTLADFINANSTGADFGVRLQSVGLEGGSRGDSSKLAGEIPGDTAAPGIIIDKVTNGADGQKILEGSQVTWTYTVSNTGNVELSNVKVTDDKEGTIPGPVSGDTDKDGKLDTNETWIFEKTGVAKAGSYNNMGKVTGDYNGTTVTNEDPSSYFGADPSIAIDKVTNGADGQKILEGSQVTWTYTVSNTGNVELSNVKVTDDKEGTITGPVSGDTDKDGKLDTNETWTFEKTGIAKAGSYNNMGTVTGDFTDDLGKKETVTDTDPSSYFGADPGIAIDKVTNGADGQKILEGSQVTWTYTVSNTGNVELSNVKVTDDKEGTIIGPVSGDTDKDGKLDTNETWTFEKTGIAKAGSYNNMGTVTGDFTDDLGKKETVTDTDPSSYFGADPGIAIDKVTNNFSVQGDGLLIQEGSPVEWIYTVTNTGNVALSNVKVTDNIAGVTPVAELNSSGKNVGDADGDNLLDITESWIYKASGIAIKGKYTNIGTATGDFTDDLGKKETVNDSDDSFYTGVTPAGARTPGFWQNWKEVWDGNATNDSKFAGRDGFPNSDILLAPYSGATKDPVTGTFQTGILVGDFNRNGVTDSGESTIFYTLKEAQDIVGASNKVQQDVRYTLDRSLVASWLNYLAVNPAPIGDIKNAISWMQQYTPNEGGLSDSKGDGNLVLSASSYAVPASSPAWSAPSGTNNGLPTGEVLNAKLDYYNNTGLFGSQPT